MSYKREVAIEILLEWIVDASTESLNNVITTIIEMDEIRIGDKRNET